MKKHEPYHQESRDNIADTGPYATAPLNDALPQVLTDSLAEFRTRLATLNQLTEAFGARAIFVTQRSARWTRKDGQIFGIRDYTGNDYFEIVRSNLPEDFKDLNGIDFYNLDRAIADAVMAECRAVGAICFDLMEEAVFDLKTDFYDPIHTSASGGRAIAVYLHDKIRAEGLFADR